MKEAVCFDDVLIVPKFSTIKSRKDVDLTSLGLKLPIIALHRFQSIEDNVKQFISSEVKPWVSIGLGKKELERAEALQGAGAETFVIDVAHGANLEVVKQVVKLGTFLKYEDIIVGNFGNLKEIQDFFNELQFNVKAYKVGIGGGSACTTRIETGCGIPTLEAVLSCKDKGFNIIADGGIRTPGDAAKAIAAGASAVMIGGMLAGTDETPGEVMYYNKLWDKPLTAEQFETEYAPRGKWQHNYTKEYAMNLLNIKALKAYRGSASKESYAVQGKDESWRTAEGESFQVETKGPVANVLARIEGGLRSSYSYVGASNTKEFQEMAEFIKVSSNGVKENGAHGKQ